MWSTALTFCLVSLGSVVAKQPHIVIIIADDYGWNDIGYHNGGEMKTPQLDQLAADGIKLENYYVQPICSPTRSQLLSGKYQIHTGLQHLVIEPCVPTALPVEDKTLANRLKSVGYNTHVVGKWHIGFYKKEFTPTYRGFDSFFGYLQGGEDYYTHARCFAGFCGVDMNENQTPTDDYRGEYSTELFTRKAQDVIDEHDPDKPLFLHTAYQAVHSPLEVPDRYLEKFQHIETKSRRIYAAMVAAMDEGVRNITTQLKKKGMWEDTILLFTTDNGGQVLAGGNNAPLRGNKDSYWEGGVRGVGFLSGPALQTQGMENRQMLHVSDWYPTLFNLAGGNSSSLEGLDGFDQWSTITKNTTSPRTEILHNIDEMAPRKGQSVSSVFDTSVQAALRQGDWKILTGDPGYDKWAPEPQANNPDNDSDKMNWLEKIFHHLNQAFNQVVQTITDIVADDDQNVYLFNIAEDPEERNDLSKQYPNVVNKLLQRLAYYNSTQVPINFPPIDKNCDPSLHGGFWVPWQS